ncbi:hypothetical protein G9G63_09340 [Paenibacillus sp. EKM202P]|uniref:hypothetical protein n=1 Tax=unclassified Paenibacillus TaxID=185978 RepID=UPI0013E9D77E|nr:MULTISPECIES: hypothetical protein [unclassified Paenibacillus]KAF6565352.1 hypothetical protein G9G63_09340 [Paenibacillus sp. EKM202P]KAF6569323.1 hypothetical protein G9G64_12755 [Paenibacillus sp. EKM207P]
MFYVGLAEIETFDVVETPIYNKEVGELLQYIYGDYYEIVFVVEGEAKFFKPLYKEPISDLLKKWTSSWKAEEKNEYKSKLARLKVIIQ